MKRFVLAILVLVLGGAAAWLLGPDRWDPLASAGEVPAAWKDARGESSIVGVVRRGARPVAGRVEVRRVEGLGVGDEADPDLTYLRYVLPPNATIPIVAETRVGNDGRFSIEGLGVGVYDVTAISDDGGWGAVAATIPSPGARVGANPVVRGGRETLRGRVLLADGRPWSGMVVVDPVAYRGMRPGGLHGIPVRLDGLGHFTLPGLEPGRCTISAVVPGSFRATATSVTLPHAGEHVFVVDAGFEYCRGRVVDHDGLPVAGEPRFEFTTREGFELAEFVLTDADGRFRMHRPVGRGTLEIRRPRRATVKGRVTRADDGVPVARAFVRVEPLGRASGGSAGTAWTDADGRYQVTGLEAGEVAPWASTPGWITRDIRQFGVVGYNPRALTLVPGGVAVADLVLVSGLRGEGRVIDDDGVGVVGAAVQVYANGIDLYAGRGCEGVSTGPDGRFVLPGLVPGTAYHFTAQGAGFAAVWWGPVTTPETGVLSVEIRFPKQVSLDVTVLDDASSAPIQGASAGVATVYDGQGGSTRLTAITATDGSARIGPFHAHAYRLHVGADGYVPKSSIVGERDEALVVRLRRGLDLSGRVVRLDGSPAPPLTVMCEGANAQTSGPDGTFRFRGLAEVLCRVSAGTWGPAGPRYGSAEAWAGSSDVTVVLPAEPSARPSPTGGTSATSALSTNEGAHLEKEQIEGVIQGPAGDPVPGALVVARPKSSGRLLRGQLWGTARARSDARGAFRLLGLALQDYELLVDPPPELAIPEPVPARGGARDVSIQLEVAVAPVLTVLDAEDRPVAGAIISTIPESEEGHYDHSDKVMPWQHTSATPPPTDAAGTVHLRGLSPSRPVPLRVRPNRPDLLPETRASWLPRDEIVHLARAFRVEGVVRDSNGKPLAGAWVTFRSRDHGWESRGVSYTQGVPEEPARFTADDGRFVISGLPSGPVALMTTFSAGDGSKSPEVTVEAGATDVVLSLDTGIELVVTFDNWPAVASSKAKAHLQVHRGARHAFTMSSFVSRDGVARFRGLRAADECGLYVPPERHGWTVIRTGLRPGTDVTLHLTRGRTLEGRVHGPAVTKSARLHLEQGPAELDVTTGADGRFTIYGLADGIWEWTALPTSNRPTRLEAKGQVPEIGLLDILIPAPE